MYDTMTRRLLPALISALLMLAFTPWNAQAQNVTDTDFYQEGDKVAVTFHLDRNANIYLYVSTDGGDTFKGPLKNVSGDAGENVTAGRCRILWDPIAEYGGITGDNICFQIKADPGKDTRRKYTSSRSSKSSKSFKRNKFVRFGMGIGLGGLMIEDEDKSVLTFSVPMELSLGRVDQRLNFAVGETFSFMKNTVQFTTVGIFRLRAFELMYIGVGGGLNINVYTSPEGFLGQYLDIDTDDLNDFIDTHEMMFDSLISGAVIAEAGLTLDSFDLALNYKYDFMNIPEYTLKGTVSVTLKYYF